MTKPLNFAGRISIGGSTPGESVNLELGRLAGATSSINETSLRSLADIASGPISLSSFFGRASVIPNGVTWTTRLGGSPDFRAVIFDPDTNQFIAVGDRGIIRTSPNGSTWTTRTSGITTALLSVAASTDIIVAVGASGRILSSTDGITWTSRQASGSAHNKVIFANSQFVAVGDSGSIRTSPDGITWTSRTGGTTAYTSVAGASGNFVAVGFGSLVRSSSDGITWTIRTVSGLPSSTLASVIYGNNEFIFVGTSGACATSSTGTSWTVRSLGVSTTFYSIAWSGSLYAIGGANGALRTSPTGATWTSRTSNVNEALTKMIWANSRFIASSGILLNFVTGGARRRTTSTNGTSWTNNTTNTNEDDKAGISDVAFGNLSGDPVFVSVGSGGHIDRSSGGSSFTTQVRGSNSIFSAIASNGTIAVAVGPANAFETQCMTSTDGITWTRRSIPGFSDYYNVIWSSTLGLFVAVGASALISTSPDGITWTQRSSGVGITNLFGVTWTGNTFLAIGPARITVSTNGTTWANTAQNIGFNATYDVAWSSTLGLYVAAGDGGTVSTSPDGTTWTTRPITDTLFQATDLIWNGRLFALADFGRTTVRTSPDGINWTNRTNTIGTYGIGWTGNGFVAVGGVGEISTSPDGITWTTRTSSTTIQLNDVTRHADQMIAVGEQMTIVTSSSV